MREPSRAEQEDARVAAEVARRAIRRLDMFEWLVFAGAAALAVGGGWAVAWLTLPADSRYFRATWIVSALLLMVIPGMIVMMQNKRAERAASAETGPDRNEDDG